MAKRYIADCESTGNYWQREKAYAQLGSDTFVDHHAYLLIAPLDAPEEIPAGSCFRNRVHNLFVNFAHREHHEH